MTAPLTPREALLAICNLQRWRDIGDGPVDYTAGSKQFAADVIVLLREYEALRTPPVPCAWQGIEPVAWRWRPRGATAWIYDPTPEWRVEHQDSIEVEPLYAALPSERKEGEG